MGSTPRNLAILALTLTLLPFGLLRPGHAQSSAFDNITKPQNATVSIMALTSYAHQGFAGNQDIYLADVALKKAKHEHETAKLIDFYPNSASPIRRSVLTERHFLRMRLQRSPECDAPAHDILIATRESNIFDGGARTAIAQEGDQVIPCYKIMHDSTRLSKK